MDDIGVGCLILIIVVGMFCIGYVIGSGDSRTTIDELCDQIVLERGDTLSVAKEILVCQTYLMDQVTQSLLEK